MSALTGCSEDSDVASKNDFSTAQKSPEGISEFYVDALLNKDYNTALKTYDLDKDSFVTTKDIEWFLPQSSLKEVLNINYDKYEFESSSTYSEDDGTARVIVKVINKKSDKDFPQSKKLEIKTKLNNENLWVIDGSEFYYTDFLFRVPGGKTEVFINNVKVPDSLISNNAAGGLKISNEYTIKTVGKRTIDVRVKSTNFDYSKTLLTCSDNEFSNDYAIFPVIENAQKYYDYIQTTWNELHKKYAAEEEYTSAEGYISSENSREMCTDIWHGFDVISGKTSVMSLKSSDFELTICKENPDGIVYWISDNLICCNFNYELKWTYAKGAITEEIQDMHYTDAIVLKDNGNDLKINNLVDNKLFTWANQFSNEW